MATRRVVKRLLAAKYFCYFNKMNALISVIIRQPLESAKAVGRGSKTRGSGRNGLGAVLALVSHFRGPSAFYLLPSKAALGSRWDESGDISSAALRFILHAPTCWFLLPLPLPLPISIFQLATHWLSVRGISRPAGNWHSGQIEATGKQASRQRAINYAAFMFEAFYILYSSQGQFRSPFCSAASK